MSDRNTILFLGGGVGGIVTPGALRKRLGRSHRIVLIDREHTYLFAPSLLWLMVGEAARRRFPDRSHGSRAEASRSGSANSTASIRSTAA